MNIHSAEPFGSETGHIDFMNRQNKEKGVALLFALGLLSLMSVLGVAFVANALTAQKIAVNLGARNQAQVVLDSAVNRIMITLMALLRQDNATTDFSVIYSTNDGTERTKDTTKLYTYDQLNEENKSKLDMFLTGLPKYDGSKSKSTWVYVRDNDGRIIARMAYQVLPTGTSSLSLDKVLKGIYNPLTKALVEGANKNASSWNQRIGRDINELYIGRTAAFRQEWSVDNDAGKTLPGSSSDTIVSSFGEFFTTDIYKIIGNPGDTVNDPKRQIWLRRWFSESGNASPEVFYLTGSASTKMEEATPYHRFNLGPIEGISNTAAEKWYPRFKVFVKGTNSYDEAIKNSNKVVDNLLAASLKFYPEDNAAPSDSGISYLRQIAKDGGSFGDIEKRRRQIAANLNDYCDEDSIPTSDISAEEWSGPSVAGPGKMPQYTGNEKTPYINEFVLGVKLENFVSLFGSSAASSIKFDLTPKFYTELIDIYGGATADYELKSWFRELAYEIEVTAKVKVTFEDDSTEEVENVNSKLREGTSLNIDTPFSSAVSKDANDASAGFQDGYWVVVNDLKDQKKTAEFQIDDTALKDKMTASSKDKVIKNRELVSYKVTVKKVTLGLAAVGLFSTTGTKPGVDFVRGPASAIESTGEVVFELDKTNKPVTATTAKDWDTFYLSGMEVRDPRQNLNFTKNQQGTTFKADASDWKCVPVLQSALAGNITDSKVGSLEMKDNGTKIAFAGKVNSCSNPKEPFNSSDNLYDTGSAGVAGENYDKETVDDPAYTGTAPNQHLSTAFIRNAPMQSLWELGVIHRASAWETINIKSASVTEGSSVRRMELSDIKENSPLNAAGIDYIDGDGMLLDQVKLTSAAYSGGKLDVNMLHEVIPATPAPGYETAWNDDMCRALLANVRYGQQISDLYTLPENPVANTTGTVIDWGNVPVTYLKTIPVGRSGNNANKYVSRADFVQGFADPNGGTQTRFLANGYGLITNYDTLADAQQEELVGKTVNLLTAGATAPATIQAVVVVQTVKGIKADNTNPVTVVRPTRKKDGSQVTPDPSKTKTANTFDVENHDGELVYFDEITSELRALVTIKKINDASGIRLQLHSIQYY